MLRVSIILFFIQASTISAFAQTAGNKHVVVYTVTDGYMEECETGKGECKPIVLKRHSLQDSLRVVFPSGGTQSDVYLYAADTAFIKWIEGGPSDQPQPLRRDRKLAGQGPPILDLTGLGDGKYFPHMLSCNVGGFFEVRIETDKKGK
jgi:hypothetical protein